MRRIGAEADPLTRVGELAARHGGLVAAALVPDEPPPAPLGDLVAAGPLGGKQPVRATVFEAVREGYLCHYGVPRLVQPEDADLALLLGDLLYALGLRELAALGDPEPVELLAGLIAVSAEIEATGRADAVEPLWLARAVALGTGQDPAEPALVDALLAGDTGAGDLLAERAREVANALGIRAAFDRAREAIQ